MMNQLFKRTSRALDVSHRQPAGQIGIFSIPLKISSPEGVRLIFTVGPRIMSRPSAFIS